MNISRYALLAFFSPVLAMGMVYAGWQMKSPAPQSLAAFAPQGALLAIESADFAGLLHTWNKSDEQKRWLAGDDYSEFSRSRVFGRLGDAQSEFAAAAELSPDTKFLQQIAGGQSLFTWYNIGDLQFLYITRLPAGEAANSPLMQLRDRFEQRKEGDTVFYVRTSADASTGQSDDASNGGSPATPREVAFAVRGDFLLLATREDLLAGALDLMQKTGGRSLQTEGWYASAVAAAGDHPGNLRMTLNLGKIVASPYFRSYWVQQNITEMKQYRSALTDLFHDAGSYREERILLPVDATMAPTGAKLGPLLDLVPVHSGVYRAEANPSGDEVIEQMEEKLISRSPSGFHDTHIAPVADLSIRSAGDASDLEQRIDAPLAAVQTHADGLAPLRAMLAATAPTGMLVFSSATQRDAAAAAPVFAGIHAAVALQGEAGWDGVAMQSSLTHALQPGLSASDAGLTWQSHRDAAGSWYQLDGAQSIVFAIRGKLCIVASDVDTLKQLLAAAKHDTDMPQTATVVSGFELSSERPEFDRLSRLLDHTADRTQAAGDDKPMFFSGNMVSLGDTFRDLDSETFVQSVTPDHVTRQTVRYSFRQP